MSSRRQSTFNLILAALCLLGLIAGAEIGVRVAFSGGLDYGIEMWKYARWLKRVAADPLVGHEHVPGRSARLMGVDVTINSKGLRDREFDYSKPEQTRRVLMLGDSLAFGWGVPWDQTTSKQLEVLLRNGKPMNHWEVINTGVGNYNTAMEVRFFLDEGTRYQPDIVIVNYFINDAEPTPSYQGNILNEHLQSWVYLTDRLDLVWRLLGARKNWTDYYRDLYRADAPGWRQAQSAMKQLGAHCREHGLRCLLVNQPELHDLKHDPFRETRAAIDEAAAAAGLEVLDLYDTLKGQDEASLWVTPDDAHPNGRCDALFARAVFDYLEAPRP